MTGAARGRGSERRQSRPDGGGHRAGGLVVCEVALPGGDPRGARVPVPEARPGGAGAHPRADRRAARHALRPRQGRGGALDRRRHDRRAASAASPAACTCPRSTAARAFADRLLPRLRGVRADRRDAQRDHGRAPVDRDEGHRALRHRRAEGALPARPRERPQAGRSLYRAQRRLDVASMETRAEREADGAWRLDGLKHYIGNGSKAAHPGHVRQHRREQYTAFILEQGMEGLEVGKRFDTMGLRGNDLREVLQRDPGSARERARRARRRLPDRHADPQHRPALARHRIGRRREVPARQDDRQ